jgi:hypothetical protein
MNTPRLILTLPNDLREAFEDLSTRTGSPLAELIRRSMRAYLELQRPQGQPVGPEASCGKCGRVAWVCGYGEAQKGGPAVPLCGECF